MHVRKQQFEVNLKHFHRAILTSSTQSLLQRCILM